LAPEEVARRLGEDRTTVVNYLRLLELPDEVKDAVRSGQLGMGHARAILAFSGHAARVRAGQNAIAQQLSVRSLEEMARKEKAAGEKPVASPAPSAPPPPRQAHIADLEQRLQHAVGTKVRIQEGRRKGVGRLVIEYYSLDDFDRITSSLGLRDE
jgi:ParB family chromosome partitioning protein